MDLNWVMITFSGELAATEKEVAPIASGKLILLYQNILFG
jgi:hypothetical protein